MTLSQFPVIDTAATGANILRLRRDHGLTVRDLQRCFGFDSPQAIYKWQRGQSLPSVDHLYALSILFQVSMNEILVSSSHPYSIQSMGSRPQSAAHGILCRKLYGILIIPLPPAYVIQLVVQ